MSAKNSKCEKVIELLVGLKDLPVDTPNSKGLTPVIIAAENGNLKALQLLNNGGANLATARKSDFAQNNPRVLSTLNTGIIMTAIKLKIPDAVQEEVNRGYDLSQQNSDGETALTLTTKRTFQSIPNKKFSIFIVILHIYVLFMLLL